MIRTAPATVPAPAGQAPSGDVVRGAATLTAARVRAAAAGDREAFSDIVRELGGMVFAMAYARTGDRSAADDVTQETFLRAWTGLADLREPRHLASWLGGVVVRVAGDLRRKRARGPASLDEIGERTGLEPAARPASDGRGDAAREPDEVDPEEAVRRSVGELPEIFREVVVLKYIEKASYERMADVLGISVPAVNKRLQKARALLEEALARAGVREERGGR